MPTRTRIVPTDQTSVRRWIGHGELPARGINRTGLAVLIAVAASLVGIFSVTFSEETMALLFALRPQPEHAFWADDVLMRLIVIVILAILPILIIFSARYFIWTICILIATNSIADAQVPVIDVMILVIRYGLVFSLICIGIANAITSHPTDGIAGWLCRKLFLFWALLAIAVNGVHDGTVIVVLSYVCTLLGIIDGGGTYLRSGAVQRTKICQSLAIAGLPLLFLHAAAVVAVPGSFLSGRFTSVNALPTNFAQGFGVFLIALCWFADIQRQFNRKVILMIAFSTGAVLMLLSATNNGILMVAAGIFLILSLSPRTMPVSIWLLLTLAGIAALSVLAEFADVGLLTGRLGASESLISRIDQWSWAWDRGLDRPLLGYGPGTDLADLNLFAPEWARLDPHSAYLGLWLQTGLVGMLLFVLPCFGALGRGLVLSRDRSLPESDRQAVTLGLSLLVAILFSGIFELSFAGRMPTTLFSLGLALAVISSVGAGQRLRSQVRMRRPVG